MAQTTISIRIDEDIKKEAEELFNKLGLNISSAVNVFFRQSITEQAIPFEIKKVSKYDEYFNPYNMKIIEESIAELEAGKGITMTMAELEAMANE